MQVANLAIGDPQDVPMALVIGDRSEPKKCPRAAALLQQAKDLSWYAVGGGHVVFLSDIPPVLCQGFENLDATWTSLHCCPAKVEGGYLDGLMAMGIGSNQKEYHRAAHLAIALSADLVTGPGPLHSKCLSNENMKSFRALLDAARRLPGIDVAIERWKQTRAEAKVAEAKVKVLDSRKVLEHTGKHHVLRRCINFFTL